MNEVSEMTSLRTAAIAVLLFSACAWALVTATGTRAPQPGSGRTPVLVELFTSEGCSSCPPADDLLRRLLQDQPIEGVEVIAISEHVDYWNRLGWTDPFSSSRYSDRQSQFAEAFGAGRIYTPQLVIDGRLQVVGSDWPAVRRAVLDAARSPRASVAVSAARSPDNRRAVVRVTVQDLPARAPKSALHVMVAIVEDQLITEVRRGENARRRLQHDAVARGLASIGSVGETDREGEFVGDIALQKEWVPGRLRVVAFLQDESTRRVVGAASGSLE